MTNKPMLSVELLPCPFCGSPASLEDHRLVWCVRCTKCSACVLGDRAPEPHGDGVSSDEVQDAQADAMSERTDWAAYEKSAVDTWNLRSELGIKHQAEPVAGHCTHPPGCKSCSWCGFKAEHPAPLKIGYGVTVENIGFGSEQERKPYLVFDGAGCLTEVNLIDVSLVSNRRTYSISELNEIGVRVEQPAPVADHNQCEECKGWGYHENHHEGGGTECGGSGNATVAEVMVMPDRMKVEPFTTIDRGSKSYKAGYNAAIAEVAKLNGLKT